MSFAKLEESTPLAARRWRLVSVESVRCGDRGGEEVGLGRRCWRREAASSSCPRRVLTSDTFHWKTTNAQSGPWHACENYGHADSCSRL